MAEIVNEYQTTNTFSKELNSEIHFISLLDLQNDYKNDDLKMTSVDIELSDYIDENIDEQVNININSLLENKYITEIIIETNENELFCAFSFHKNTKPFWFQKLKNNVNLLPNNIILPLSKLIYTQLYLMITNIKKRDKIKFRFKYYDEHSNDINNNLPYSLYNEETKEYLKICNGLGNYLPNKLQCETINKINDALEKFELNQDVDLVNSSEAFTLYAKKENDVYLYCESYSSKQNEIHRGCEFAFALKHNHINPVKCSVISVDVDNWGKILSENKIIHEFIALPNNIQWLLNGVPLLLIKTPYCKNYLKYTDIVTNEEIFISTKIYKGYLPMEPRRQLSLTNQLCCLGNTNFLFYSEGLIKQIKLNATLNQLENLMVRQKL
jgi:hypothetical protein